ncbi:hypothetical protein SUDANB121_00095 [Nocardiopsis dassonvillei]|uniref:hypothetical protein n=1 Tax=Nocardiopsis dassonvillei TaxID=2014 RepID=UPI003F55BB59
MSDGLIDPEAIPIPEANVYELQSAAAGMKTDGEDISQAGADISTAWASLQGVYSAPEAETLFAATDPVPTKGEDTDQALNTAARALEDFAETAQRIRGELTALRAEARDLVAEITSDEDWNSSEHPFDFVSEKGQEHDALLGKVNALVQEYQQAERDCANAITRTFGGTTFIGGDLAGTTQPGPGEVVYGLDEPLENVATPWGSPQGTDYYWTMDAALAGWDVVRGGAEDVGGMVGAFGAQGWFTDNWGANAEAYWGDALVGMGAWAGVYNPGTNDWVGSFGEGFEVYTNARLDAVHGFFPWTELEERPGYAFGTLGTNLAVIGAGVALTATGAGAVVGVPLTVSRVVRIFGGVGSGDGPHLSGGDGSGAEGGQDRTGTGTGTGVHGNGSHSSSPSAPGEGAFSADREWKPSDLEDMNTALSDLEAAQNPTPAPEPTPAPHPENPAPEPRPEPVVPDRSPDTATTDGAPQQPTVQERGPDPTAQEVDQAFAEIAQNNEDLADRMDRQDGGQMVELDPDTSWTINPTQTTTGGGDGPADGSRVPVTPDGVELRADNEATNNTDNGGSAPQPSRDENPITIHETEEQDLGGSSSGGPPEPPRPPGPGPDNGGPESIDPDGTSEIQELSSITERSSESGFSTMRDDSGNLDPNDPELRIEDVRSSLDELDLSESQKDKIIRKLQETLTGEGRQVTEIIQSGRLNAADGFSDLLAKFGSSKDHNFRGAAAELRFAYDLVLGGRSARDIEFPPNSGVPGDDVDVVIKSETRENQFSYQIKDVESKNGVRKFYNTVVDQLSGPTADGTRRVGIFEVNQSINELPEAMVRRLSDRSMSSGVVFRLYFTDGVMTVPPGTQIYPE